MSFLRELRLDHTFKPFAACLEDFGFIPKLLGAQTLLPRLIVAQTTLEKTVLVKEQALSRVHKELILLSVAAAEHNGYCVTAHSAILLSIGVSESRIAQLLSDSPYEGLSTSKKTSMVFAIKLSQQARSVQSEDIEALRGCGLNDESILETVLVTGLARFLCTLATGLGPEPDFELRKLRLVPIATSQGEAARSSVAERLHTTSKSAPFVRAPYKSPKTFAPFAFFQESHGFIPNFFRAQTLWPEALEAEAQAVAGILLPQDVLTRAQKECILLVVSAANYNSYCVAVHCNLLRGLGLSPEEGDQIAVDHHESSISRKDKALLDFALKLGTRPQEFCREDIDRLRGAGFHDEEILECVAITALNNFANTVQIGLGITPDFEPPNVFASKKMHPLAPATRPIVGKSGSSDPAIATEDSDTALVTEAQKGSLEAFEGLIRRNTSCVYRTLMAILANSDEAADAMQDVFLKAFKHIGDFQGRSKFSSWLVSIARNTAIQRLRERRNTDSLDEDTRCGEEDFRPKQVRAWQDDPEMMYSHAEVRELVEKGIMQLPDKLRVVVVLRDIEQLSTEEVARQLGLSVPALKARLFRGRLMLRELLSPHFVAKTEKVDL